MALKNAHPERGVLIESYDFDDGRLTFVKRYARKGDDGELKIDCWMDRYGEQRAYEGDSSLTREGAIALRKYLNKHFKGKK